MSKSKLHIIGLAGTNGSGKDSVGLFLEQNYGYMFISVTDLLRQEAARRQISVDRKNLRTISTEWRRELGVGVLIDKAVADFEASNKDYAGLVVASLRNPGEVDRVHEFGGMAIWIDADPDLRYERIQTNAAHRSRPEEDNITFEQFIQHEQDEMEATSKDDAGLHGNAVKAKCDIFLMNDTNSLAKFHEEIVKVLKLK